ncbi:hypothetical protein [Sphingosinicella xenopeptidilytica]|uniref:Uncharacterized protein n=1 Tax=Sphingosinicella xenopeptidilytica TaxID=364098 RepID=A0ABW3C1M3_SPHXN
MIALLAAALLAAQAEAPPQKEPEVVYIDRCGRAADFEADKLRRQGKVVIRGVLIGYKGKKGRRIPVYQQSC